MRVTGLGSQRRCSGFTLVELLALGVIIIGVGLFGFTAYSVLANANLFKEGQIKAVNLAQLCLESAEAQAQINFDTFSTSTMNVILLANDQINNSQITNPQINNCEAIPSGGFVGYTPCIAVTTTTNAQVKQVDVSISWTFQGQSRSYYDSLLVTRPPVDLPGDVTGLVSSTAGGTITSSVQVTATQVTDTNGTIVPTGQSFTTTTNDGVFTFQNSTTGAFTLPPGEYILTVSGQNYESYTTNPDLIEVFSGQQTTFNLQIVPNPQPGKIAVSVYYDNPANPNDPNNGKAVSTLVSLMQNCSPAYNVVTPNPYTYTTPASFTIPGTEFISSPQQCFTVATGWNGGSCTAMGNSWYPYYDATGPGDTSQNHLGYSQDSCPSSPVYSGLPVTNGTAYDFRGWSSAEFANTGLNCAANFWEAKPDNVCVVAGQTVNIAIPLAPNPTATLEGQITYSGGGMGPAGPEAQGSVTVYWGPSEPAAGGEGMASFGSETTNLTNGNYQMTIPAAQELFPATGGSNNEGYQLGIVACGWAWNYTLNNGAGAKAWTCSTPYQNPLPVLYNGPNGLNQDMSLGPVYTGQVITKSVQINDVAPNAPGPPPLVCMYAQGQVLDAYTSQPIGGATVDLVSPYAQSTLTTGTSQDVAMCSSNDPNNANCSANYNFGCVPSFECPNIGNWTATATGYYPYNSQQKIWYVPQQSCTVWSTNAAYNLGYTLAPLYLIQAQTGELIVNLVNAFGYPLSGFTVTLTNVDGSTVTATSGPSASNPTWAPGEAIFNNVYLSWPTAAFTAGISGFPNASQYFNTGNTGKIDLSVAVTAPPTTSIYEKVSPVSATLSAAGSGNPDQSPETITITVQQEPGV